MKRIFFATDLHGSETCFYKFINAGNFYRVDFLVLGGDLTGKQLILIIERSDGTHFSNFMGQDWIIKNDADLVMLEKKIRDSGLYPLRATPSMKQEFDANPSKVREVFSDLMFERLRHWVTVAEERLKASNVKLYITGGNDDPFEITPILKSSGLIVDPEDDVTELDGEHEMISSGYSNLTPWNCPRDISEEELLSRIESMASKVRNMNNSVFNLHVPPYDTEIDRAPKLDTSVSPPKPLMEGGQLLMAPAGSKAVRQAMEKHQPMLGLHGHIHESAGFFRIGRTLCINPGSTYSQGVLRGAIINVERGKIKGFQFVTG